MTKEAVDILKHPASWYPTLPLVDTQEILFNISKGSWKITVPRQESSIPDIRLKEDQEIIAKWIPFTRNVKRGLEAESKGYVDRRSLPTRSLQLFRKGCCRLEAESLEGCVESVERAFAGLLDEERRQLLGISQAPEITETDKQNAIKLADDLSDFIFRNVMQMLI